MSILSAWFGGVSWLLLLLIYFVATALYIVSEHKAPKSTLVWLLLMWLLPGIGVVAYLFFGRDWQAFGAERRTRRMLRRTLITPEQYPNMQQLQMQQAAFLRDDSVLSESTRRTVKLFLRNSAALLTLHNRVEILQNAQEKYPRLLADLRVAQHSISMQYYIWESDEFTQQVADILIERAHTGVQVRVLYDWLGSLERGYVRRLREAGVRFEPYLFSQKLHDIGYRNHRKIVVIDGDVGYLGGMNMSNEHLTGGRHFAAWRDTAFRVQGEAAAALQMIFAVGWFNTTREMLVEPRLYETSRPDLITPMQIVSGGPDSEWGALRQMYFRLITQAQRCILLQSPFFILDESLSEALRTASLSGIDVRIMLQPRGGVYQVPYRAGLTFCDEVARAGARVYFYQAGYFHPKTIVIDDAICSIGTANFDTRSTSINYESNAVFYDGDLARRLAQDFHADMAHCVEFNSQQYRRRPWRSRFVDSAYRLLSPLL
ncbi:MAG: cardiolipin synthase [Chloroflexi bacterium]|nr:cardiolipin synthase [Chloroflexota bacterium]